MVGLVTGGAPALRCRFLRRHLLRFVATSFCKAFIHRRVRQRMGEHFAAGLVAVLRRLRIISAEKRPNPPTDEPGTWSNLLSILCHPDYRGRGVGAALLEAFRAESRRRGYRWMRLSVHSDNVPAIALYRKCGWRPVLTVPSGTYFRRSVEVEE